jgi:4-methylaminobutanoate oxidase (formaldehyde-forming)
MSKELPKQARVVIIGGGVVGCSVAYHLTKLGWKDVVLLERKQLTCGTTWHAAGLVGQLRATMNLTRLAQYTTGLYETLEEETGQATGFMQRGSIGLALHDERMEELKRGASMAKTFGLEVETVGPDEIKSMWPLVNTAGVVGGVFLPKDGQCNPTDTTQALAKGARMGGAQIFENVKVTGVLTKDGRAVGVATEQGDIEAEYVVNCGGMWGRELGHSVGVNTPLHACEHFYIVTEPIAELTNKLPVMRVPDECAYYKEDAGKLLLGAFEPGAKPWGMDGIPEDFCFDELPGDEPPADPGVRRHPHLLQRAGELHPGRRLSAGRGAGAEELLHGLRLQFDRHPVGRWRRQGALGMDRRGPSADGSVGRRRAPHDALPGHQELSARARIRDAGAAVRHALALSAIRDGARGAAIDPA